MNNIKVISKTSDRTVVRERVRFNEIDEAPVFVTGVLSAMASFFGVVYPLNAIANWDLGLSFLAAGGTTAGLTSAVFLALYALAVEDESNRYSAGKMPYLKSLVGVVFPFGQRNRTGKGQTRIYDASSNGITKLTYNPDSIVSDATHDIVTKVKFTPIGAYIEQEFIAAPTLIWDDAFKSTLSVHQFRPAETKKKVHTGARY